MVRKLADRRAAATRTGAAPELLRALGGICLTSDPKTTPASSTLALFDLVYDGLRFGAPATAARQ